jgi:hypothetical protein
VDERRLHVSTTNTSSPDIMSPRAAVPSVSPARVPRVAALALLCLTGAAACSDRDAANRQPLGAAAGAAASSATGSAAGGATDAPPLPLGALTALEAGNAAYREKKVEVALVKYQEAAAAAPTHAAPWFGIYMAAVEMKNPSLADSAMRRVKALSADPAALDAHATVTSPQNGLSGTGALPDGHPSATATAPTPVLPPGHPTATPALPPGHPTPGAIKTDSTKRKRM